MDAEKNELEDEFLSLNQIWDGIFSMLNLPLECLVI